MTSDEQPARMTMKAQVLLDLDQNHGSVDDRAMIADRHQVSSQTVMMIAKRFIQSGSDLTATISRKQRVSPPIPAIVTGDTEARLIAMACSKPPVGYHR